MSKSKGNYSRRIKKLYVPVIGEWGALRTEYERKQSSRDATDVQKKETLMRNVMQLALQGFLSADIFGYCHDEVQEAMVSTYTPGSPLFEQTNRKESTSGYLLRMKQVCKAYRYGKTPETAFAPESIRDKYSYPWCIAFNPRYPVINTEGLVKAIHELEMTRHPTVVSRIREAAFQEQEVDTPTEFSLEAPMKRKKTSESPSAQKKLKPSGNVYQI